MQDMEILFKMIKDYAIVPLSEEYGKYIVTLLEPQSPDSRATIRDLPPDTIVLKVDTFRAPDDVFRGENGECKRADYVIISAERKCILYIEMKRTKGVWIDIVRQFQGAQCFIRFCQDIGREFWKESNFLKGYKARFVSIGHTSIPKRKTRVTRSADVHDTPNNAMKIDWPNYLQFNQLAGPSN